MKWPEGLSVGVEIEGFVYDKHGEQPIDVWNEVGEGVEVAGAGIIKTDAGRHQIEWSLMPSRTWEEIIEKYWTMVKETQKILGNVQISFVPVDVNLIHLSLEEVQSLWAPKGRYKVLWRALEVEAPERWRGVLRMAGISSIHVHLGMPGLLESRDGLKVLNFFNLNFSLYASTERARYWWGWCYYKRAPAQPGQWSQFTTWEELRLYFASIPRLIKKGSNGWEVDLGSSSQPGDPVSEGTIWWWARPRWSLGTIEVRVFDSASLYGIQEIIKEVMRVFVEKRKTH